MNRRSGRARSKKHTSMDGGTCILPSPSPTARSYSPANRSHARSVSHLGMSRARSFHTFLMWTCTGPQLASPHHRASSIGHLPVPPPQYSVILHSGSSPHHPMPSDLIGFALLALYLTFICNFLFREQTHDMALPA